MQKWHIFNVNVNMPFTKEDKILIKNLFELKDYNARHLVREISRKS